MKHNSRTSTSLHTKNSGLTLIEVLIVSTIVALLAVLLYAAYRLQITRAQDARRKADLEKLRKAFDSYYDQYECYPSAEIFGGTEIDDPNPFADTKSELCGTFIPELAGHLTGPLPCDPVTGKPYVYFPPNISIPDTTACKGDGGSGGMGNEGYRLYTNLRNTADKSITSIGCYQTACGLEYPFSNFNYGVAMGVNIAESGYGPEDTVNVPTPTPVSVVVCSGIPGNAFCNTSPYRDALDKGCVIYSNPEECSASGDGFCKFQADACN